MRVYGAGMKKLGGEGGERMMSGRAGGVGRRGGGFERRRKNLGLRARSRGLDASFFPSPFCKSGTNLSCSGVKLSCNEYVVRPVYHRCSTESTFVE